MHAPSVRSLACALVAVTAFGCGTDAARSSAAPTAAGAGPVVIVQRTATCPCCGDYEDHLEAAGFTVERVIHGDLADVKATFGIPDGEGSCHTNEVAGYAVEGHVPVPAILDLLDERPEVDGISLAGMPSGSPGMSGEQTEPFVVRAFVDGDVVGVFGEY